MRRLSPQEFEEIRNLINTSTQGLTKKDLEKRRDYLLDLSDLAENAEDAAKYRVWAGNIETEIVQKFPK